MDYAILSDLSGDTENQLAALKCCELANTIYQVKDGHLESSKVTPQLLGV